MYWIVFSKQLLVWDYKFNAWNIVIIIEPLKSIFLLFKFAVAINILMLMSAITIEDFPLLYSMLNFTI